MVATTCLGTVAVHRCTKRRYYSRAQPKNGDVVGAFAYQTTPYYNSFIGLCHCPSSVKCDCRDYRVNAVLNDVVPCMSEHAGARLLLVVEFEGATRASHASSCCFFRFFLVHSAVYRV